MQCTNCGYENEADAIFCEHCGAKLKQKAFGRHQDAHETNEGLKKSTKILIITCIALVGILGVIAGALLMNNGATSTNMPTTITQTNEKTVNAATWHQIASYSGQGTKNEIKTFQTQGNQFKVQMSGKPILNYKNNSLDIDAGTSKGNVGHGRIEWGPNDSPTVKEQTFEVTTPPGTYSLDIYSYELENWTINVYDYY